MRAPVLIVLLLTLLALAAPAVASASPSASARALHCQAAAGGGLPSADFEGHMKAVRGTSRMSMRFEVQEMVGGVPWTKVEAPALRRWRRSSARVASFSFVQRVENLRLEGAYRVVVSFKWLGRSGRVLRTATRVSDPCSAVEPVPGT